MKAALANGARLGERACLEYLPEAKKKVEQRVRDQAEAYYNGCDLDPGVPEDKAVRGCRGRPVPRATCNLLDTPGVPKTFNHGVENPTNHLSQSCGQWPYFSAVLSGRTCSITPNYTLTDQYIEDSFNRGAWIQALNCYHQQVQAEVEKGKIRLTKVMSSSGVEQDGPCAAMANDYGDLKGGSDQIAKTLESKFSGQKNIGDISFCDGDGAAKADEASKYSDANPDAGKNRQSACQLRSARRSVEAMFMQLAACEVWTRAARSYETFLGRTPASDSVKEHARRSINGISSSDRGMCSHQRVLDQFYIPNYMSAFNSKANAIWNADACAPVNE